MIAPVDSGDRDYSLVMVDQNRKAYFVDRANGTGNYVGYVQPQDGSAARRVLYCSYMDKLGYATQAEALEKLKLYLSNKDNQCARIDYYVNGKNVTRDEYLMIARGEMAPPIPQDPVAIVSLHDIEHRIAHHMRGAYGEMLAVGQCLNEAKEGNLVPHGQWEEWVRRNTGMSERQAQKLMQAARTVEPGSALSRLPISKIQVILALPAAEREGMAEAAEDEGLSLRELKRRIEDARLEERRAAAALAKDAMKIYLTDLNSLREQLRKAEEKGKKPSPDAQAKIDELQAKLDQAEEDLEKMGEVALAEAAEARKKIERLTEQSAEAEAFAEQQAEQREAAQRELMALREKAAHGQAMDDPVGLTVFELAAAVRTFLGTVGVLPHMGAVIAGSSAEQRQGYAQYVDMIETWLAGVRQALSSTFVREV